MTAGAEAAEGGAAAQAGAAAAAEFSSFQPSLEHCATEPIHIPGAIQPHGCLLAFDPRSLVVQQVSVNVQAFLGVLPEAALGRAVTDVMPLQAKESFLRAHSSAAKDRSFTLDVHGRHLNGLLHEHEGLTVLEIEPAAVRPLPESTFRESTRRLMTIDTLEALFQAAAEAVRELTGFDRVLVYRLDSDGHGQVVSEARDEELESYLGLHYPESDIPRQARALYLRNWIRTIPDACYSAVPLLPRLRPDTGKPLDLTCVSLRSISPIHLVYLANMGVRASMSMSLIVGGRLWGLISCGHRVPLEAPYGLRRACETLARIVSLQINALETGELQEKQASKSDAMLHLVQALRHAEAHGLAGLPSQADALLHVAGAMGAAVVSGDSVACVGSCPDPGLVLPLSQWVASRAGGDGLFSTRHLSIDESRWACCVQVASGVLAIVLPTPVHSCVLWFRPEIVHTVGWGGNPNKPLEAAHPSAGTVLHPRRSFELWKEEVRSCSVPWDAAEIAAVLDLRRSAIEIDLYRQVQREQEAVKARDDLVAVVAHDLRNPMSVVVMQSTLIQRLLAQDTSERGQRLKASAQIVGRAGERMSSLLNELLDLAKIEAGRFEIIPSRQSVSHIIQDAYELLQPLCEAKRVTLVPHPAPELQIRADPERIFQVLSNLIGNAIKFSPDGEEIHLGAKPTAGNLCEFGISDRGSGIAPDQLVRIFDRYWQARPAEVGGAGLGLYISRGIVEAHGGTIRAESRQGHGTTMFFTVPLALDQSP